MYSRLSHILDQPSAPFREEAVARVVTEMLAEHRVPHFLDAYGNIVIGAHDLSDYERKLAAPRPGAIPYFVAHMDHPGFHGEKWSSKKELLVKWLGGGPHRQLVGAKVWLAVQGKRIGEGVVRKAKQKGKRIVELLISPTDKSLADTTLARGIYGGFSFSDTVWKKGDLVYTKAADDLVGVYAITELTLAWAERFHGAPPFFALLTRAEEIGYLGMIHHFQDVLCRRFQSALLCVSLETSREFPGAVVGAGPVVRMGDRATVFDPSAVEYLTQLAHSVLPKKFQRRIMDGGTCEATVANAEGYRTVGISVPLGNYHNECFNEKGKTKLGSPAPEYVSWRDVQGLIKLCATIVAHPFVEKRAWLSRLDGLAKIRDEYQGWLAEGQLT